MYENKNSLTALMIALLFLACNNNKKKMEVVELSLEQTVSDTTPPPPSPGAAESKPSGSIDEDFISFWQIFRNAVLTADTNKIIELTKFPFETRGPLDDDPLVKYNRPQFIRVLNLFLAQWNGQDLEEKSEKDDIQRTVVPDSADIHEGHTRIGDLVFKKYNKKWKLYFAYLNDETIEAIHKK